METKKLNSSRSAQIIQLKEHDFQENRKHESILKLYDKLKSLPTNSTIPMAKAKVYNILLVNCSKLYAKGLEQVIKNDFSNVFVDTLCADPSKVQVLAFNKSYHLAVVDLDLKTDDLIQALEYIKGKLGDTPILMITKRKNIQLLEACTELQIQGYLLKDSDANLIPAIKNLLNNKAYHSPQLQQLKRERVDDLTHRELQVLKLIALGFNNAAIAQRLFITVETTKTHKRNIREKLGTTSTHALIQHYIKHYS